MRAAAQRWRLACVPALKTSQEEAAGLGGATMGKRAARLLKGGIGGSVRHRR